MECVHPQQDLGAVNYLLFQFQAKYFEYYSRVSILLNGFEIYFLSTDQYGRCVPPSGYCPPGFASSNFFRNITIFFLLYSFELFPSSIDGHRECLRVKGLLYFCLINK